MLPRSSLRASSRLVALTAALVLGGAGLVAPADARVPAEHTGSATTAPAAAKPKDPRKTRGLFVDPLMPAYTQGGTYRERIGKRAQALWIIPEAYPTSQVKGVVRDYTSRAREARKTPMLVVYGIPGRDCGSHSSEGSLQNAQQYRAWIAQVAAGVSGQKAIVVVEPDALPFFSSPVVSCPTEIEGWQGMLRSANKRLGRTDAWVYLDAGHSNWTPYDERPKYLKQAGVQYIRGISTNVSNFRTTAAEKAYATTMVRGLRKLGVKGKRFVIDTSRNGRPGGPADGQVINPPWARVGKPPRLVFQGAFDGTLWVKHPGESDGTECGGPGSGQWSDALADRLLGRDDDDLCN